MYQNLIPKPNDSCIIVPLKNGISGLFLFFLCLKVLDVFLVSSVLLHKFEEHFEIFCQIFYPTVDLNPLIFGPLEEILYLTISIVVKFSPGVFF
jgi:hypothetical protein